MTDPYVVVGGQRWTAWKRVTVHYGAKDSVRVFALTVTDSQDWKDKWNFMPGTEVSLMEGGDLLVKGFIETMSPSHDSKNHHIEISGKSKSNDSHKAAAEHKTGEFRKKNILKIAKDLDKQEVGYKSDLSDEDMPEVEYFRLNPGETVHEAIERLARKQQLLLIGQADGSVRIDKGGSKQVNAPLILGQNILSASASFSDAGKHSEYKVKGQKTFGVDKRELRIVGTAKDESVKRRLPKHIVHGETDLDQKGADKRAKNHKDRQQGESVSASVRVAGWRDQNGMLYKENTLIHVVDKFLKLDQLMLIETVDCSMSESGSYTQLSLVQPKALGSDAGTGSNTNSVWQ